MSDPSDWRQSSAAEFPNDNPALHGGAIWVCFAPCGPLRPVVRPRPGARPSTIPAPFASPASAAAPPLPPPAGGAPVNDVRDPEALIAPPEEVPVAASGEAPVTEVTCLAARSEDDLTSVDLTPAPALEVRPPLLDLTAEDASAPEGCSLSAGLEIASAEVEDPRASELRERPVECAPSAPHVDPPVAAEASMEESDVRRTILPPPSEETRTLTLTRIHVPGRSQTPPAVETALAASVEVASDAEPSAESEQSRSDPFAAFVAALVEVALAAGATRAAALIPGFLDGAAQDFTGFSDAARTSLLESGIAHEADGALGPSAAFGVTASAWRMVLRGESNDFSACGTSTLDGWAGDLLKSFGVGRDGKVDVKRELRRRGVAAFGMILAA